MVKCTCECSFGVWLLKAKLEAHHKIDPGIRTLAQGLHNGSAFYLGQTVG